MKTLYCYYLDNTDGVYAHVPSYFVCRRNRESYLYPKSAESIVDGVNFLRAKEFYLNKPLQENQHRFFIATEAAFFDDAHKLKSLVHQIEDFEDFAKIEIITPVVLAFRLNELLNEHAIYRDTVVSTYEGDQVVRYHVAIVDGIEELLKEAFLAS